MSAKYHALANAAQQAVKQRMVPTGARSWSRALPSLEVSFTIERSVLKIEIWVQPDVCASVEGQVERLELAVAPME